MPTQLPADPVLFEQAIRDKIADIFMSVPIIAQYVKVYSRERFPDNEAKDIELSTVDDPVNPEIPLTSIIQIGIPTVEELEYVGDTSTQLNFTYPITFDLAVKDMWMVDGVTLEFDNSSQLALMVYMRARTKFKENRTLGFENCVHNYLQQENAGAVPDEETGSVMHAFDWSLTVQCTSVVV